MTEANIVFLDNSIHQIFKTIQALKDLFPSLQAFNNEADFEDYLESHPPQVILINLDIRPLDGIQLVKELKTRPRLVNTYMVLYADRIDDYVQELAYNSGVDFFIGFHRKPAITRLFLLNLSRRLPARTTKDQPITIDREKHLVFKNGVGKDLPRKEFLLFELLFSNPGKFISKKEIALTIWHDEKVAATRTIDVHVCNLRNIFGKNTIVNKKEIGYRFNQKMAG
jgi:DNA-binding response OmpR family regulator